MPSADQPYSRESFRSRWENERFASLVPACVDWNRREITRRNWWEKGDDCWLRTALEIVAKGDVLVRKGCCDERLIWRKLCRTTEGRD